MRKMFAMIGMMGQKNTQKPICPRALSRAWPVTQAPRCFSTKTYMTSGHPWMASSRTPPSPRPSSARVAVHYTENGASSGGSTSSHGQSRTSNSTLLQSPKIIPTHLPHRHRTGDPFSPKALCSPERVRIICAVVHMFGHCLLLYELGCLGSYLLRTRGGRSDFLLDSLHKADLDH